MKSVMSLVELFTLFYYALEAQNTYEPNDVVTRYLKYANPHFYSDLGSADKKVFFEFEIFAGSTPITTDDYGYFKILRYLEKKNIPELTDAFRKISFSQWKTAAVHYLAAPHKGETKQRSN